MMIIIKIFSGLLLINAALVVALLERIADLFAYSDWKLKYLKDELIRVVSLIDHEYDPRSLKGNSQRYRNSIIVQ